MLLELDGVCSSIELHTLSDLKRIKEFMDLNNLKVNKSKIARQLHKDRRTVDKYLNGYERPAHRVKGSIYDEYLPIITELLSSPTQIFYYRSILFRYLQENHGLVGSESTFRHFLSRHPELDNYFKEGKISNSSSNPVIRFETAPGEQAQLDWKEEVPFVLKDTGEIIKINIFVLLLAYSRHRVYRLALSKTRDVLIDSLTRAFEVFRGVPKTILIDNPKTIMDKARTMYNKGKISQELEEYSKDFGFKFVPCIAATPKTKGKVENPMKILDELRAYSGKLNYVELAAKLTQINNRINMTINKGTGRIPIMDFEKEKGSLQPLPNEQIRNQYKIKTRTVKVNSASMITVKTNQYSVPPKYVGKNVCYQIHDSNLYVYSNTTLIAFHTLSLNKLNYDKEHYTEILAKHFIGKDSKEIATFAKYNLLKIGGIFNGESKY